MKIIVLHGDNTEKLLDRLDSFISAAKKRDWDIEKVDTENKLNLSESLTAGFLFEKERLFLVREPGKLDKTDLAWLKKNAKRLNGTVVFYSEGILNKTTLSLLPKPDKVEEYKVPQLIFKFLEAFYPGNGSETLKLLHEVVKAEAPEFVLAFLARHLKDIFLVKLDSPLDYPSWRVGKLESQAKRFTKGELKEIIGELAQADIDSKTSKRDLLSSLDLIIVRRLE